MRKHITRFLIVAFTAGILVVAGSTQTAKAQDVMVSYQTFYDNLAPYGQWIYDPQFGNVWVPNEGGDFRPYGSRGQWVMTEYGNTWVSDDPWGWAVYHYGRWTYNPYYGWIWVPGYDWAPAWVSWRFGGGYAGWAPLGPGVNVGSSYYAPDSWWVFVGPQYMYQPNCIRYWHGPSYNNRYIRQTTIINNYYIDNSTRVRYNYGPRAEVVQQVTRKPVQVYRVSQLNRPGAPGVGRNTVSIYRPGVNRGTIDNARPGRVMQAPQPIGRGQQAPEMGNGRQPAFRQEVQRRNAASNNGGRGNNYQSDNGNRGNTYQSNNGRGNQPGRQDNNVQPGRTNNRVEERGSTGEQDTRSRMQPGRYDSRMDSRTQEPQQPVRQSAPARQQPQQPVRQSAPARQQPVRQSAPARQQPQAPVRQAQPPARQQPNVSQPARQAPQAPARQTPQQAPTRRGGR